MAGGTGRSPRCAITGGALWRFLVEAVSICDAKVPRSRTVSTCVAHAQALVFVSKG